MNRLSEIELMRLLHGELPPERAYELHERLAREPELAAELRRLEATWGRLDLPATAPAPSGFARAVVARAESAGLWSLAPTRVRFWGGALLATGLALGIGLASGLAGTNALTETAGAVATSTPVVAPPTVPGTASPSATAEGTADIAAAGQNVLPRPTTSTGAGEQVADLDDLPTEDGSYADEGTLADDFWQAFDETDSSAVTDGGTTGSEAL